jgi:hypothetical protein
MQIKETFSSVHYAEAQSPKGVKINQLKSTHSAKFAFLQIITARKHVYCDLLGYTALCGLWVVARIAEEDEVRMFLRDAAIFVAD